MWWGVGIYLGHSVVVLISRLPLGWRFLEWGRPERGGRWGFGSDSGHQLMRVFVVALVCRFHPPVTYYSIWYGHFTLFWIGFRHVSSWTKRYCIVHRRWCTAMRKWKSFCRWPLKRVARSPCKVNLLSPRLMVNRLNYCAFHIVCNRTLYHTFSLFKRMREGSAT